ncbi:MAG: FAD-dependent oxidoreductase [Oscillospiraceae bacterium]|nr:FAD-dependent oxidoreductase [Oscillospiraceae bacterium]
MKLSETMAIVENCFHGEPASCSYSCPFNFDTRAFLGKVAKGKWVAAYKALRNAVVFPVVVSRLCPAPCKSRCQYVGLGNEAIEMPLIERAVIAHAKKKIAEKYVIPPKNQSIAVVGAGVSGLACALDLAQKKYAVTVFDSNNDWGGTLRRHDDFELFDEDFAVQFGAVDLTWQFNSEVKNLDALAQFDAVYLATGKGGEDFDLLGSYDPVLCTTSQVRIFMGGELVGAELMGSIAMGTVAARCIEAFLQTGKADSAVTAKEDCSRYVVRTCAENISRIVPESGCEYSEDEAMHEAARCMQCDCSVCIDSCEMLGSFRKKPKKIATEVYTDTQISATFSSHTLTRQTYSCNMCGHCQSVCPEGINMGALFAMSRRNRFSTRTAPYALHDFWLREMDFNTTDATFVAAHDEKCTHVFYPGCQLGAHNPEHVLSAYEVLNKKFDCGVYLGCCGAPAFWAGDDERLHANMAHIRKTAKTLGDPVFVFACATCEMMFAEHLPEIERTSVYKVLADDTELKTQSEFSDMCVFDPCAARDNDDMMNAVRTLTKSAGINIIELHERNQCCGYGGLVCGGNPKMFEKIAGVRAAMSDKPYVVYCAHCREVFLTHEKNCVHILDIALNLSMNTEVPAISERRKNSLYVKAVLMKELKQEVYEPIVQPWAYIKLVIEKGLAEEIDQKLISEDDLKETVWCAESTGDKFVDEADGSIVACLVRRVLTYWVQYKPLPDGSFEILNAYYHRMRFTGAGG